MIGTPDEPLAQLAQQLLHQLVGWTAVEEVRHARTDAALEVLGHQVGSVHPAAEIRPERIHRPDDRLPVRDDQRGVLHRRGQLGVVLAGDDGVGRSDTDVALPA